MPLSRRYSPEHPPLEQAIFGMDFSFVIPPGVGLVSGVCEIWYNRVPPFPADQDWTIGPVSVLGRVLYASLTGGTDGTDYQIRWRATDTDGKVWPRTALVLCAQTS